MLMIGHRGVAAFAPENTLESFKKALDSEKADGFECDIRRSKDKKLVVIHDEDLKRISNKKELRKVSELTTLQLAKWKVPTLQQVLDLKKKYPKKLMLIEIKEEGMEKDLVEMIRKNDIVKQVLIVSFNSSAINRVKHLFRPDYIKTGFIFAKMTPRPFPIALGIKADWIIPLNTLVDEEIVETAHDHKMKVLAWTIENPYVAKKMEKMGIDAIVSNSLLEKSV